MVSLGDEREPPPANSSITRECIIGCEELRAIRHIARSVLHDGAPVWRGAGLGRQMSGGEAEHVFLESDEDFFDLVEANLVTRTAEILQNTLRGRQCEGTRLDRPETVSRDQSRSISDEGGSMAGSRPWSHRSPGRR